MLLIVLIKDKPEPLELVESDAVVSSVVNAIKNKKYDYMVFSGNSDNLKNLSKVITSKIYSANQDIKKELINLATLSSCKLYNLLDTTGIDVLANLMFEGLSKIEASKLLSHVLDTNSELNIGTYTFGCKDNKFYHNCLVTASLPEGAIEKEDWDGPSRSPGKTTYPAKMNITDANKKCWQYVIKNYSGKIKSTFPDSFGRQWIMAMIIYQRVCLIQRLRPWLVEYNQLNSTQVIRDKLVIEDEKADIFIDKTFSTLKDSKLALRLEDLRFWGVEEKANNWVIKFTKKMTLPSNVVASEIFEALRPVGWLKMRDKVCIELSTITDIELVMEDSSLRFFIVYTLPTKSVKDLLSIDTQNISQSLNNLMNIWMSTGKLRFRKKDLAA